MQGQALLCRDRPCQCIALHLLLPALPPPLSAKFLRKPPRRSHTVPVSCSLPQESEVPFDAYMKATQHAHCHPCSTFPLCTGV